MLDFRIHTFLCVCKNMNYTKAAEELHITQPAVSQHIHYLENLYEAKLFDYNGKKLYLTDAGKALLQAASTVRHDTQVLKEQISALAQGHEILSFGATLTVGEFMMPEKLAAYIQDHPDVQLQMQVQNTDELLQLLKLGDIDFAIIEGYFPHMDFDFLPFSKQKFIGVCGPDYPKEEIQLQDLFKERIILREPGSGSRDIFEHYLTSIHSQLSDFPNITVINNIQAIKQLVMAGCGITFLYEAAVKKELQDGTLLQLPLKDMELTHDISFIWNKGSIYQEHYKKFYHFFQDQ